MSHRLRGWFVVFPLVVLFAMGGTLAYAQGGATSSLSGTVTDSSGGVVPGADIVVKNVATGDTYSSVSGAEGGFNIPSMPPGTYTATVSLMGFKTVVLNDVTLNVGVPATVKAVLEPGELQETVVVAGATEVIQTQTASVATTMNARQIANLPVTGRAAFDLVGYMAGVVTSTGSLRDGTVNGLTQASVNITLDGMNIQDNYAKTWDGMFTRVSPRIDAVEEVTVTTAAQGADTAGQGSVQMRFVTRSGTNKLQGSAYYYLRRDWMNTNTWFNENKNVTTDGKPADKPTVNLRQPGGRIGGPVVIPGLFDGHDKMFFFVNYELLDSPGSSGSTRTIMSPLTEQGVFQYGAGRSVNLLELAAKNGHIGTIDPTIAKLLGDIRATTSQGSVTTTIDPLTQSFFWQQPTKSRTTYPTVRVDYNLTANHRVSFSTTRNHLVSNPDTGNSYQRIFPGFPVEGLQDSNRYTWQGSARSVVNKNMVNELRLGGTGGATLFAPNLSADMFRSQRPGQHGRLRDHLEQLQEPQQPVLDFDQQLARGLDEGPRGHVELAEGPAQPQLRRFGDAGGRVGAQQAARPAGDALDGDRRPGRLDVQRDELPRRVEHGPDQRQADVRGPDRPRLVNRPRGEDRRGRQHLRRSSARATSRAACGTSASSRRTPGAGRRR